jgi:hypothetical protein
MVENMLSAGLPAIGLLVLLVVLLYWTTTWKR